jgi:hypothetical protein
MPTTLRSTARNCGLLRHGKPVAVTEFGCCTYAGAARRGGLGWTIVDTESDPPRLAGDYVRDETEQVAYLQELLAIFEEEGMDSAFWFTFASYDAWHRADPRYDLDMAAYGVVRMLEDGQGTAYPGLGGSRSRPSLPWRPLTRASAGS